jgi:hypothetical protein
MKKIITLVICLLFSSYAFAQPSLGLTNFQYTVTSNITATGACTAPKTASTLGWAFTISSSSNCLISQGIQVSPGTDGHINFNSSGTGGTWLYGIIQSGNGSNFNLLNLNMGSASSVVTGVQMIFVGYLNGSPAPGATLTSAPMSGLAYTSLANNTAVNFTTNPAFSNIDEIRFTPSIPFNGNWALLDITIGTATVACATATLSFVGKTNVLCNGGSTGSATMSASGGPGFTYTWFPSGGNAAAATGLAAGNYTCITTNSCGATDQETVSITQPASALATSTAVTNALCNGTNGSGTITASGGTSPYTYTWSSGATSQATSLSAGNYTVKVTDNNGCNLTKSLTITQPTALSAAGSQTNVLCFGQASGGAKVTASGGTSPYTYIWSTAATGSIITGQTAGVKTCTTSDANNCKTINSITITQPASAVTGATAVTHLLCNGVSTGAATVVASGGSSPFSFNWSSGQTSAIITGLNAATRTCTITDNNGCNIVAVATTTQPASALSTATAVTNVACFGGITGAATITASGGTAPYSFLWSGAQTNSIIGGQNAGIRTVTVTDANACTASAVVNITQPVSALTTSTLVTNVLCFGNASGAATVIASGGSTPYSYLWSGGQTSSFINGQIAGVRTVTVTDANNCKSSNAVNITQPASGMTTGTAVTNVLCFGGSTGAATVSISGGSAPYSYAWSGAQTTSVISGQNSGVRTVTVTDANACTTTAAVNITQPASALSTATNVSNVSCFGTATGAASVTASGGTAPYSFLWSTAATTSVISAQTTGVRTVTVTDANACTTINSINITQPSALATSTAVTNVLCFGSASGAATVIASGGITPYSYSWSGGQTSSVINGQIAGVRTVTVTDANNCTSSNAINITQPASGMTTGTAVTNVLCFGGSTGAATVSISGGSAPYSYAWSGAQTTSVISVQNSGVRTVTVTDASACTTTAAVNITQPASALSTATNVSNVLCFGTASGAATVTASGGTAPYSFLWSNAATTSVINGQTTGVRTVTVTDANACTTINSINITQPSALATSTAVTNVLCFGSASGAATVTASGGTTPYSYAWSGGQITSFINGQTSGVRTVTVTDANNCTSSNAVNIAQPASGMTTGTAVTNVLCFGGSTGAATVSISGGSAPYSYAWSGAQTTSVISGQNSGVRTVTVTDASACTTTTAVNITQPASALSTATNVSNVLCFGTASGAASVTASGGTAPYSFLWSNAATTSVITAQTIGVRTVTVTDANACTTINSINITQPSALATSTAVTNVLCFGSASGAATVIASGGTTPYSYSWSGGQTSSVINGQIAGVRTVTVTDANNCASSNAINITQPPAALSTSINIQNVLCFGGSTGAATIIANGGTTPYSYFWTPSATGSVIASQAAGLRTYTVVDGNACNTTGTVSITQPTSITINIVASPSAVCSGSNTTLTANATGGTGAITYTWVSGAQSNVRIVAVLALTVYTVNVSDANSCFGNQTISINPLPNPTITVSSATICAGQIYTLNPSGASTYTFSSGSNTVSPISNQTYSIIGTSSLGCLSNNVALSAITVYTLPTIGVNSGTICSGNSFTISPSGAASYTISGGNFTVSPTSSSNYTVIGTGINGCVNNVGSISQVTVFALPNMSMSSGSICPGNSFTLNPLGAGTYTYLNGGPIVTPASTASYSVIGTSSLGCPAANTVVAVVTVSNTVNITITGSANICSGQTATLVGNGANTYSWSSGATSTVVNLSPLTNTSYTLFGVTGTCSNTAAVNVTVNTTPTVSIIGTNTLCLGASITLTANGASSYSWNTGSTSASVNVSPALTTTYSVIGTTTAGCSKTGTFNATVYSLPTISVNSGSICNGQSFTINPTGANSYTISGGATVVSPIINTSYTITGTSIQGCNNSTGAVITVTVNPNPTVAVNATPTLICSSQTATLIAAGASNYSWTNGANNFSLVVTPSITTAYTVTGIDNNNCSSRASISLSVNPSPTISITSSQGTICVGESATLTATGGATYTWSSGNTTASLAVNPTVTTSYSVDATGTNGCKRTSTYSQIVNACTGINSAGQIEDLNISIYPNPNSGVFTVSLASDTLNVACTVYNNLGQVLLLQKLEDLNSEMNLNKLENGIYYLIITVDGNKIFESKVIKQ